MSRILRKLSKPLFEFQSEIFYSDTDSIEITELGIHYNNILITFNVLHSWGVYFETNPKFVMNYYDKVNQQRQIIEFASTENNIRLIEKKLKQTIAKLMVYNKLASTIEEAIRKM